MTNVRFVIHLTKPNTQYKTWIRVETDTGFTYVNVGHHGRFYGNLANDEIRVTKSTVGNYRFTYTGLWESETGKRVGNVTKTYYFTVGERDRAAFERIFHLS